MLSNEVKEIMTHDVMTVRVTDSISEVVEVMAAENVGRVMVTDHEQPVGIFTERDVWRRVAVKKIDSRKTPIKKVMTNDPVIIVHSALIGQVLAEMNQRGFRNMRIRGESGELIGVVYAKALDVDEGVRRDGRR